MFNIQKHLRHVVLALGLVASSLTAGAAVLPTYQIGIADTATSDIGSIDLVFSSLNGAASVTANLSRFTGTPLVELDRQGAVSDAAGGYSISNAGVYNDLYLEVGGPFGFDLNFSEGFLGFNILPTTMAFSRSCSTIRSAKSSAMTTAHCNSR